jgi:hypothetical protein
MPSMASTDAEISLRPATLGGSNPFAGFGKGAGFGIKAKKVGLTLAGAALPTAGAQRSLGPTVRPSSPACCARAQVATPLGGLEERVVKKTGPRVKYGKEFLMQFMEVRAGRRSQSWAAAGLRDSKQRGALAKSQCIEHVCMPGGAHELLHWL